MSADEDSVKTGSPQAHSASFLQLSDCSGGYRNMMVEGTTATPDFAAACPVPGTAASPKHTSTTEVLSHSDNAGQRGNENIDRKNSFHHSKQQQQQQQQQHQTKVMKRRNTASFGFKHPVSGKRRRRANSESDSVLPTNFLLGGNIFDPLNLNSLLDEDVNRALNAETPKSSPLPAKSRDPVEILIPRDITDPLNLNSGIADSSFLVSPFKSGGRRRHRNRHHGGGGGGGGISNTQIHLSESGKAEVKSGCPAPLPGVSASSSALDVSKESDSFSSLTGDSLEHSADTSASCKEDATFVSMEESASFISGGSNQHTGKRRRRRNSGKTEPSITHSTPIGKSGFGDKSCNTGRERNSQSFHTPRCGSKKGPGGRQNQKFQFGNYNKYYGYRNPGASEDPRVRVLRQEWFEGKEVLDLGCNSGHMTLYIAKILKPARILGLDIDNELVRLAQKNIRHYLSELQTQEARRAVQGKKNTKQVERNENNSHTGTAKKHSEGESRDENGTKGESGHAQAIKDDVEAGAQRQGSKTEDKGQKDCDSPLPDQSLSSSFPVSLRISRGPIAAPPLTESSTTRPGEFPSNVSFVKANYVLENDGLLDTQRPEYDVILCLSVTKWVQLNWGDSGLKRLFKRVYRHLRPGGLFILEPQPWESYFRRRRLTDKIRKNYHSIQLRPDQFPSYLTSEVGFTSFEHLGPPPKCSIKGFQRPIYVFHK